MPTVVAAPSPALACASSWSPRTSFRGTPPKPTASIPRTIALNALHDKAFDRGLITFDTELRFVCASSLRDHFADATVAQHFQAYEGKPLTIPAKAAGPKPEYLEWHREVVFGK